MDHLTLWRRVGMDHLIMWDGVWMDHSLVLVRWGWGLGAGGGGMMTLQTFLIQAIHFCFAFLSFS